MRLWNVLTIGLLWVGATSAGQVMKLLHKLSIVSIYIKSLDSPGHWP